MGWLGEMPLKDAFPGLYDIACDKSSLVAAHLSLEYERHMIGRRMTWPLFLPYCILLE